MTARSRRTRSKGGGNYQRQGGDVEVRLRGSRFDCEVRGSTARFEVRLRLRRRGSVYVLNDARCGARADPAPVAWAAHLRDADRTAEQVPGDLPDRATGGGGACARPGEMSGLVGARAAAGAGRARARGGDAGAEDAVHGAAREGAHAAVAVGQ